MYLVVAGRRSLALHFVEKAIQAAMSTKNPPITPKTLFATAGFNSTFFECDSANGVGTDVGTVDGMGVGSGVGSIVGQGVGSTVSASIGARVEPMTKSRNIPQTLPFQLSATRSQTKAEE